MAELPSVSVVMPVFNAERFVGEAIRSILEQTFRDFELIIIDDGSTDGSEAAIRTFTDPRIRYHHQTNQGIARALNTGISMARAPLIARQDADDISLPRRLERQVAFMAEHPDIGLLGTWAEVIHADGLPKGVLEHGTDHLRIRYLLLFDSAFVHPSVLFRKDLFLQAGPYDPDPAIFEDLELWHRMVPLTRAANLPEHLLIYRDVPTGLTNSTNIGLERLMECRRRHFRRDFPEINPSARETLVRIGNQHALVTTRQLMAARSALFGCIRKIAQDEPGYEGLLPDALNRLMSYRIVQHRSIVHRALDRMWKRMVLGSPTNPAQHA